MNKEVGFEIRGFEESRCGHLLAVYTKCLKTVFNGSNLYRFKNFIFYRHTDGRWCVAASEKAMMKGVHLLRTAQPTPPGSDGPCQPSTRWERPAPAETEGRGGWLPCPSLVVSRVTFRYVHHWRNAFVAKHSAPLHVQGMGPSLAEFNGFYKAVPAHQFPDPAQKQWTVYQKTTASELTTSASVATAASSFGGARTPTMAKAAALATAVHLRSKAFLFRVAATGCWAFAESLESALKGGTSSGAGSSAGDNDVVVSSVGPAMHPADSAIIWRLRENKDWTYRLLGVAITVLPERTLAQLLDVGNLEAHRPIKINFRHADGDIETFFGTDRDVEEFTGICYVSATPRFIFRNSFGKYMVANEKADVEADRGIYRSCAECHAAAIDMHRWEVWNGSAWKHVSDVFCEIDLSQHILRAATSQQLQSNGVVDDGHGMAKLEPLSALRASRSCDEAASPGDEGVKRVEVFEMGPVDIYVAIVPSDTTISMSMAGYVSDLIVELARLHRIPFFSNPRVLCEGRQFPPLTPLHLLPRRRMVQVHFDPLPPLSSLRQLHHGHNVVCARDLARFGGLARTSRCAVGLNGNLLRGSIRLPFHRHAPIQELEIVELAVSSSVDTAGNVGTMIPIEQANDGDDSDELGVPSLSKFNARKVAEGIVSRLDGLADLMHPNVQAFVCIVVEPVAGVEDFPRRICFEHCGDGDPSGLLRALGRGIPPKNHPHAGGGATLLDQIRTMREYGVAPGHFAFARCFAADCLAGLEYLHNSGIVHGAVLPRNIRFSGGRAVLCNVQNVIGSLIGYVAGPSSAGFNDTYYVAPETAILGSAVPASDIFSLACCFLQFVLVHELELVAQAADVAQAQRCVPELRHLLGQCLEKDHERRFTAAELLQLQTDSQNTRARSAAAASAPDEKDAGSPTDEAQREIQRGHF